MWSRARAEAAVLREVHLRLGARWPARAVGSRAPRAGFGNEKLPARSAVASTWEEVGCWELACIPRVLAEQAVGWEDGEGSQPSRRACWEQGQWPSAWRAARGAPGCC